MTTVYTALYGGYDTLRPAPAVADTRFVVFTDDADLDVEGWETRAFARIPQFTPWMNSKLFKILPHFFLPEAERTLWVDASHEILAPEAVTLAFDSAEQRGVALHAHPEGRDCIYDEALEAARFDKYAGQPVLLQAESYRREGHPDHWGLWATGAIARIRSRRIDLLMDDWWDQTRRWTPNCQLSLAHVLWQDNLKPGVFPHNYYRSPWFRIHPHLMELAV